MNELLFIIVMLYIDNQMLALFCYKSCEPGKLYPIRLI